MSPYASMQSTGKIDKSTPFLEHEVFQPEVFQTEVFSWTSARHVRAKMLVFPGFGGLTEVFGRMSAVLNVGMPTWHPHPKNPSWPLPFTLLLCCFGFVSFWSATPSRLCRSLLALHHVKLQSE